jgi:hypothetical protein
MYHPQTELRQHTHVDDCQLTVNVCLGKEGFKGGDLFFYGRRSELDGKPPPPRNIDGAKLGKLIHIIFISFLVFIF